jgi:hypothetical protein
VRPAALARALSPGNNLLRARVAVPNFARVPAPGRSAARAAALLAAALFAACGEAPESVPEAPAYRDPGFVEAEGWRLHYALTPSLDLPAGIAGSYGIVQRPNLAVLVIALEPSDARAAGPDAAASASATAVGLTGERAPLALVRRDEAGRPTWLASVEVRHRVPVTIEIQARATPAAPPLVARLTREFRVE